MLFRASDTVSGALNMEKVRIDKWLWAVRIFKTRQSASDACSRGHVTITGQRVKPSRMLSQGEEISVKRDGMDWIYGVKGCIEKRVGAKLGSEYRLDLTPEEDIEAYKNIKSINRTGVRREKGAGRPTKKERRDLDKLSDH